MADDPKYKIFLNDRVKGIVIGDNNTVTINYISGEQRSIPIFLAPPRPPYNLVGRGSLISMLKQRLIAGGNLAISALNGSPGIGKTALAVELAYDREVLEKFPDGVLWAGLGQGADALFHLGLWAKALGISSKDIANLKKIEERKNIIQTSLGLRRMLIVVDDAWDPIAASAFKVGGPNCVHLLTTRLAEVAGDFAGERTLIVHELNEEDSISLLEQLAPEVVNSYPDEVHQLVKAIGGLPLGLIIIGKYLWRASHNGQQRRIREALSKLQRVEERINHKEQDAIEIHPGLSESSKLSLSTIIQISDNALNKTSRKALRALSVFPSKPNTFSEEAALVISNAPTEILDILSDASLLESSRPNRYMLHQTIADYSSSKLKDKSVYTRLVDYFISYIEKYKRDYDHLDLESNNILASFNAANQRGMRTALVRGVNTLHLYWDTKGLYSMSLVQEYMDKARIAAKELGDYDNLITILCFMGQDCEVLGKYELAEEYFIEGLKLAEKIRNKTGLVHSLRGMGVVSDYRGNYLKAKEYFEHGIIIAREIGQKDDIALLLEDLGVVIENMGDHEKAQEYLLEALDLSRDDENHRRKFSILTCLGWVEDRQGNVNKAEQYWNEALKLAQIDGFKDGISTLAINMGNLALKRGDYPKAKMYLLDGLNYARETGNGRNICLMLENLGSVAEKQGDYGVAEQHFQEGLTLARNIGLREDISYLLANLGLIAFRNEDYFTAKNLYQESLNLAREIESNWVISFILCNFGELHLKLNEFDLALRFFNEALQLASDEHFQDFMANALFGLAKISATQGNKIDAEHLATKSLNILDINGNNDAEEVRIWLSQLK